jgi:hypothetical protein
LARRRPHPARRPLLRAMRPPLRAAILQVVQPRLRTVRLVPAMRQQARAMPPSAPATSPFPKLRSTRRVVLAPARRLALAQPSTPLSMSTQVAPPVARRRLEPVLARRARRRRAVRFIRRRRRSCGRRLCRHRTQQYHRRLHRRTWPHRRHRSASLPLRRRHGPPRRRDPRRLRPKSARRINQSAERPRLLAHALQASCPGHSVTAGDGRSRLRGSGSLVALSGCILTFWLRLWRGSLGLC